MQRSVLSSAKIKKMYLIHDLNNYKLNICVHIIYVASARHSSLFVRSVTTI
jgi:hypothetical protein